MKDVPFRQNTGSGCGSFCLANLFNDKRFLSGVEDMVTGESVAMLNKKMELYVPELYIDTLYATCSSFLAPANQLTDNSIFGIWWSDECFKDECDWLMPMLVTIKRFEGLFHSVLALHELKTDKIFLIDSLRGFVEEYDIENFLDLFFITAINRFVSWQHSPDQPVFIERKHYSHIL